MSYFDPNTYNLQNANKPWSYKADGGNMRFEVRSGDHWNGDHPDDRSPGEQRERSEIASFKALEFGKTYTVHYKMMIEPGQTNTAKWLVAGQFHAKEDPGDEGVSPPYEFVLSGEKMQVHARWSTPEQTNWSNVETKVLYKDAHNIERGHWYDIRMNIEFDPFGDGVLDLWRDGVQLVDYSGPIGYNDEIAPHWKQGVYRLEAPETIAINYKDFTLVEGLWEGQPTAPPTQPGTPVPPGDPGLPMPPNVAPSKIGLSQSSIAEMAEGGTMIGALSAQDINPGDSFNLTLLNNADGRFALDATATNLLVLDGSRLDYEQSAFHTVTIRVTDRGGLFHDENLTIAVQDVSPEKGSGSTGDDVMVGGKDADTFKGGFGKDRIIGGRGADKLWGETGADVFAYMSARDSAVSVTGRDVIYDFSNRQKDKIDLREIDANAKKKGNQSFTFIGEDDFHHKPGELRYEKAKNGIVVSGDTNGDGRAEMSLFLKCLSGAENGYFVL
jgi:hypothetical protein